MLPLRNQPDKMYEKIVERGRREVEKKGGKSGGEEGRKLFGTQPDTKLRERGEGKAKGQTKEKKIETGEKLKNASYCYACPSL
jgi:hypothetical protein